MFGFSNSRPGRGISKEDAAKRNYFDIFGRHLGHIIGANFWYLLANIIFFGAALVLGYAYFNGDNFFKIVSYILQGKNFFVPPLPF
ncbi:MAG: hypothetical protein J6R66_03075, partial [Clostridia bacterium]|nr:hypothetical protein [Clostridia bacterium]